MLLLHASLRALKGLAGEGEEAGGSGLLLGYCQAMHVCAGTGMSLPPLSLCPFRGICTLAGFGGFRLRV